MPETEPVDVEKIRGDFPILKRKVHGKRLVYLDNAATTQKPQAVIDSIVDYYSRYNSNVHRSVHALGEEATAGYEGAREKVAKFVRATPNETVFVRGTTEATNLVRFAWGEKFVKKGDLLVATLMEHHSNIVPWQLLARSRGATLKYVGLTPEGTLDMGQLEELLREAPRLLAFTHCSNVLGTINDAASICAKARSAGTTTVVDGAQSVPHFPVDLTGIGADFYAYSVTGDTPVLVQNNDMTKLVPIEEAVSLYNRGSVTKVLTLGEDGKLLFERVTGALSHLDGVYAIEYENSALPVMATAHHSVYVWRDGDVRSERVSNLRDGDYLVTFNAQGSLSREETSDFLFTYKHHNHEVTETVAITRNLMRLIGYYLAEGSISPDINRVSLAFGESEGEYISDSKSIIEELNSTRYYTIAASGLRDSASGKVAVLAEEVGLDSKTANKHLRSPETVGLARERFEASGVYNNHSSHTANVYFSNKKWCQFFSEQCGTRIDKRLPSFAWSIGRELVYELLRGYLRGDASKNERHRLVVKTVSKRLATELSWLLKLHGISNSLGFARPRNPKWHDQFILVIQRSALGRMREFHKSNLKEDSPKDMLLCVDALRDIYRSVRARYDYRISSILRSRTKRTTRTGVQRVVEWIKSTHTEPMTTEIESKLDRYLKLASGDIGLLKIRRIKPSGKQLVYDISVDRTERFFGGFYPILLHNSGHKMLGPTGIGVLVGKKQMLEDMDPFEGGGEMIREVFEDYSTWNDIPYKFEAGTVNIADTIGLGAAVDYLSSIGMDKVRQHEVRLLDYAHSTLSEVKGFHAYGPEDTGKRSGLIAFNYADVHPHDLATILDEEGVAIRSGHHCAQPLMRWLGVPATSRASFHLYNSYNDIDALKAGILKAGEVFKV